METVSILGCGWLGFPLALKLIKDGFMVKGSTTSAFKLEELKTSGITPFLIKLDPGVEGNYTGFFSSKILIINIPPPRAALPGYHGLQIKSIVEAAEAGGVEKAVFISSTSVYNEVNGIVKEEDAVNPVSESGAALIEAERVVTGSNKLKSTIIRFGGLIGPGRNPGRFLAGRKAVPGGSTPVNLIHLDDCIEIISGVIRLNVWNQILNAVSVEHPSKQEFYTKAAEALNLEPPQFGGSEQNYKIVDSTKLQQLLNYTFIYPDPLKAIQ